MQNPIAALLLSAAFPLTLAADCYDPHKARNFAQDAWNARDEYVLLPVYILPTLCPTLTFKKLNIYLPLQLLVPA